MNTSEAIKLLQAIDKTVPFDAEVVSGTEDMPFELVSIKHEPPYTFLDFNYPEQESDRTNEDEGRLVKTIKDIEQEQQMMSIYVDALIHGAKNNEITEEECKTKFLELILQIQRFGDYKITEYLLKQNAELTYNAKNS